jgi:hypothetical protein
MPKTEPQCFFHSCGPSLGSHRACFGAHINPVKRRSRQNAIRAVAAALDVDVERTSQERSAFELSRFAADAGA